jgi:hypothetical protein
MKYKAVFASLALASAFAVAQPNGITESGIQGINQKVQGSISGISGNTISGNANQSINLASQSLIRQIKIG